MIPPTLEWRDGRVRMIDQRLLPARLEFLDASTVDELCDAIRTLAVRGAPALGVAGAMGVALAAVTGEDLGAAGARIIATRPTAVNLAWGVARALAADDPVAEAVRLAEDDVARNRRSGAHGAPLVPEGGRVLTHCNAGALACAGYGTALGVIRAAHEAGKKIHVWVDETRPRLQGMKLTAWECRELGIPATIIADNMAASLMRKGRVDAAIVGADRIAANGDTANKIGTYGAAVLANAHGIPFYVAAPLSTVDFSLSNGDLILIEERPDDEVTHANGVRLAPEGVPVYNPAFDVTPAEYVAAIITERGIAYPPFTASLEALRAQES